MLLRILAGLTMAGPLFSHSTWISSILFPSWVSSASSAGLLLTSQSLELVMGTKKLGKLLSGSLAFTEVVKVLLSTVGYDFHTSAMSLLVSMEVLYYAICPYSKLLQLSPNVNVGSGLLVVLLMMLMTNTPNDVFNLVTGLFFGCLCIGWMRFAKKQQ